MKRILPIMSFLLLVVCSFSQNEYSERIAQLYGVEDIGISPAGEIWIATDDERVYYTRQFGEIWHFLSPKVFEPLPLGFNGRFQRVNFFSEDTLMISGQIHNKEAKDVILWSGDHGNTWERIDFGERSVISEVIMGGNGMVWMGGSASQILFSKNFGRNWVAFSDSESGINLRYPSIFFSADLQMGVFGASNGDLYLTDAQGGHWNKLPTPASQAKHPRFERWLNPGIEKIRIIGEYFIIKQAGRVFVSSQDSVDWKYVHGGLDFEVTENVGVYLFHQDQTVSLLDHALSEVWHSSQGLEGKIMAMAPWGNSLIVLTFTKIYKVNSGEIISSELFTDDIPIQAEGYSLQFEGEEYNFYGKDILRYNKRKEKWYRYLTLDTNWGNAVAFQGKLIVSDEDLTQFYAVNTQKRSLEPFDLPDNLFENKIVKSIGFEDGYNACFNAVNGVSFYERSGDIFEEKPGSSSRRNRFGRFKGMNASAIDSLVLFLEGSKNQRCALSDLGLSDADIDVFKQFLDNVFTNPDAFRDHFNFSNSWNRFIADKANYSYFKSAADSILFLSDSVIHDIFTCWGKDRSPDNPWKRVVLYFEDGEKLILENNDDEPNFLYSPWIVKYEGLYFRTNSILLGKMIDRITQGKFIDAGASDKNYAIFRIINYLHEKKLEAE